MQKQLLLLLLASLSITAQAQDLYNLTTIETTFAESNWDQILDQDYNNGDYILAQSITNPLSESDGIDKFSPQRAEHEPYGIAAGTTSFLSGDLVINEFMASNDTTQADQDGDFDDWIELYNNTSASISLDGFYLSDDTDNLTKWAFPDGTSIGGNGYLIIWADQDVDQNGLHADFKLSAGGESVVLIDAGLAIVDSITYLDQKSDISHGRFPNGTGDFQDMRPTFNAENTDELPDTTDPELTTSPLTLFPNPTAGMINVRLEQAYADDLQFFLYATDGRLLRKVALTRGSTTLEIDATDLPDGFYFLSVTDELAVDAYKVVIRK